MGQADEETDSLRTESVRDSVATLPLVPGVLVGRYVVRSTLGRGAMGVVYAAYDPELDRHVALKLLRADAKGDEVARRERLRREARAMAKLAHVNVVAIHDVGEDARGVYLAMDLINGQTLDEWLWERRDWRSIAGVFLQVARGLAAAHAADLVHRDLKPTNVLIDRAGVAKISDFGLVSASTPVQARGAVAVGDSSVLVLTRDGDSPGTPAYMAPEQLRGECASKKSDQFAFAICLYQALAGARPYPLTNREGLLAAMDAERRAPMPKRAAPRRLLKALNRALSAEPRNRFSDMDAFVAELEATLRVQPRGPSGAVWLLAAALLIVGLLFAVRFSAQPARAIEASIPSRITVPPSPVVSAEPASLAAAVPVEPPPSSSVAKTSLRGGLMARSVRPNSTAIAPASSSNVRVVPPEPASSTFPPELLRGRL